MPITVAEFNALKARVALLETAVADLELLHDSSETGSIEYRLSRVEATMVSIQQVYAVKTALEAMISSHDQRITDNTNAIRALQGLTDALQEWRTDIRHELIFEQATNLGGGTSWELSNNYDQSSPFLVFQANLTLVDPANIVFGTDPTDQFTSSVSLTEDVRVLYFVRLPDE